MYTYIRLGRRNNSHNKRKKSRSRLDNKRRNINNNNGLLSAPQYVYNIMVTCVCVNCSEVYHFGGCKKTKRRLCRNRRRPVI